ncbi:hypothetical protein ACFL6G_01685 [candidate division KSB1 bacterium]
MKINLIIIGNTSITIQKTGKSIRKILKSNIRGEERFNKLMERVKYEWENFEV